MFIDRDGTLIAEPADEQVDTFEKLEFEPGVVPALLRLQKAGWRLVMVTNQDGLGTKAYPKKDFEGPHSLMMQVFTSQGVHFDDVRICPHFPKDKCECRKPKTKLVDPWLKPGVMNPAESFVVGDRETDLQLARNMGIGGLLYSREAQSWSDIARKLCGAEPSPRDRHARVHRKTKETDIAVEVFLDREGESEISTGIGFFDHMLDQIAVHGGISLKIAARGDLSVDCHHTVEDVGLALGSALKEALGDKRGIGRFGFMLPMDECLARCALDISGRPWLKYDAEFRHALVGELATEMIEHFFHSLAVSWGVTLHLKTRGKNDHHRAESLFKCFGRTLRQAVRVEGNRLPSSKGAL